MRDGIIKIFSRALFQFHNLKGRSKWICFCLERNDLFFLSLSHQNIRMFSIGSGRERLFRVEKLGLKMRYTYYECSDIKNITYAFSNQIRRK